VFKDREAIQAWQQVTKIPERVSVLGDLSKISESQEVLDGLRQAQEFILATPEDGGLLQ
jgi:hypothetical protein